MYLLRVSDVELPCFHIAHAMSDSKYLNTTLIEVTISSNDYCVCIRDLSDVTLQIILDVWWASVRVNSTCSIACDNSQCARACWFHLHWAIEKTAIPGIMGIVRHHILLHLSESGTNSMGKHLLTEPHIAQWNKSIVTKVTELTTSTATEIAVAILMKQRRPGITSVSLDRKIIFNIYI